jgi:hypothetical protein
LGFGGGRRGGIGQQKTRGIWRSLLCFCWKAGRQGLFGLVMTAAFVDFEIFYIYIYILPKFGNYRGLQILDQIDEYIYIL